MPDDEIELPETKSGNFVVGISSFLLLSLLIPGGVTAFFFVWSFGSDTLKHITGSSEVSLLNAIAFSLVFGLIFTPFAFVVEQWISKEPKDGNSKFLNISVLIMKGESSGKIGWYFYQVWSQFIMHWNIAVSLTVLLAVHLVWSFWITNSLSFSGSLRNFDWQSLALLFTIVFNFKVSTIFKKWHDRNVDWLKTQCP